KWDKEKKRFVKIKTREKFDDIKGTEEGEEVSEQKLKGYIKNEMYRLTEFNAKTLKKELPIPRKEHDVSVDVYIEFMEDYLNRIRLGRKPDKSYYVSAPDGFGKKFFAYQVIKDCLAHGFEPTEILSTQLLYEYLKVNDYKGFFGEFQDKDVGIVTLGGAPTGNDIIVVKTILEFCDREGIPLLILSRYATSYFRTGDAFIHTYLGVRVTKRGDYGRAELKGFTYQQMRNFGDIINMRYGDKEETSFRKGR